MTTSLEHINVTVTDPDRTAQTLCALFDWQIRWKGESIHGGRTLHVGTDEQYIAVYSPPDTQKSKENSYFHAAGLNHLGILVDDLDAIHERIKTAGYETYNFGDYEPGRRFYFRDEDNIEFEIVSYAGVSA